MPATIVMGGQWGDEGKGKLTDALAVRAGMVVRANGGANAGHTVETAQGVFKLHLVPSGILNPACMCVVGSGVVIDLAKLLREMDDLESRGVSLANLKIAERAHTVMPYHPQLDRLEEEQRADDEIGTTRTGNGPAYADKVARRGIRVADLMDPATLRRKVESSVREKNALLAGVYGAAPIDAEELIASLAVAGERLRRHVVPAEVVVQDALARGNDVVLECAQGAMLDVDYGTYPFVTSSSPTAAGACQGAGVAPLQVDRVIGVYKAYATRVGGGPLPTELENDTGQLIRERGREYGTTTGRPRRTGWFDAVAARHIARLNGVSDIALTLLDVLDAFDAIEVCTAYRIGDRIIDYMPARDDELARVEPVYETVPGWRRDTTGARAAVDLPEAARAYIRFVEERVGAPVSLVGVGPAREQLVALRGGL
ncbi:MAG: adenylosuccinate synthase [Chloroflexota bacterium]